MNPMADFTRTTDSKWEDGWSSRVLCAVLILCTLVASPALARKKKQTSRPPGLPEQINALARELYGVPLDSSTPITRQIQTLVLNHLQEWFASGAAQDAKSNEPLDVRARQQIEYAFSELHYPLEGNAAVFIHPCKGGQLIGAGYTLGWPEFRTVNTLALYEYKDGKAQLLTLTHFVPRTDLRYAFIPPGANGDLRFMVYGLRMGMSQPRLTAILYSFDGAKLHSLWEVHDAYDGKLQVTADTVTLRYLKQQEYVQFEERGQKPPGHEAVYKVTPEGLRLLTDHQIPF
ncbi:MAG: hypothetical protein ACRD3T_18105 [Terriglobia bacterium]